MMTKLDSGERRQPGMRAGLREGHIFEGTRRSTVQLLDLMAENKIRGLVTFSGVDLVCGYRFIECNPPGSERSLTKQVTTRI